MEKMVAGVGNCKMVALEADEMMVVGVCHAWTLCVRSSWSIMSRILSCAI